MPVINIEKGEINCLITYVGPGLAGKRTNIEQIYKSVPDDKKGKLTCPQSVLSCDVILHTVKKVQGLTLRFFLRTVTTAHYSDLTKKLAIVGTDGIVFVADSHRLLMDRNLSALDQLIQHTHNLGYNLSEMPYVLQLNYRDLVENKMSVDEMIKELRRGNEPVIEAIAYKGIGVFETLNNITHQIYTKLDKGLR